MSEHLILQGSLQTKKMKRMKLATRCQALIKAIKSNIQSDAVTPLAALETGQALSLMQELHDKRTEYIQICSDIDTINKELGQ